MSEHVLLIGAYGWRHARWRDEFYPGDLPDEWQLGYYGNEFPVVLIPAEYWSQPDLDVAQWLEETDSSPGFLTEWPQDVEVQQRTRDGMSLLGSRGLGILITLCAQPVAEDVDVYKQLLARYGLIFDLEGLDAQQRETVLAYLRQKLGENSFGLCWHGDEAQQGNLAHGPLTLTRIRKIKDVRELRRIIETNIAYSQFGRKMLFIVDGDPPELQLVQNAGIILDLL